MPTPVTTPNVKPSTYKAFTNLGGRWAQTDEMPARKRFVSCWVWRQRLSVSEGQPAVRTTRTPGCSMTVQLCRTRISHCHQHVLSVVVLAAVAPLHRGDLRITAVIVRHRHTPASGAVLYDQVSKESQAWSNRPGTVPVSLAPLV